MTSRVFIPAEAITPELLAGSRLLAVSGLPVGGTSGALIEAARRTIEPLTGTPQVEITIWTMGGMITVTLTVDDRNSVTLAVNTK